MTDRREQICKMVVENLADLQGMQASYKGLITDKKGTGNIATPADMRAEEQWISALEKAFPGVPVHSEESMPARIYESEFILVDPLDGSTNFFRGHSHFANALAWFDGGEPVVTAAAVGEKREVFSAEKGKGAYLDGEKIRVRPARLDDLSIIAYHSRHEVDDQRFWDWFRTYRGKIRNYGSVVSHICQIACQRIDLCILPNIKLWDFAGPGLILMEAGGVLCDSSSAQIFPLHDQECIDSLRGYSIIASNGEAHIDYLGS